MHYVLICLSFLFHKRAASLLIFLISLHPSPTHPSAHHIPQHFRYSLHFRKMSGNFKNNNDPRFSQHRPYQSPQQQHNNSMFRPPTPAGQVPPFIDPRTLHGSNGSQFGSSPNGRHPVPPVRFPGHQPQHGFPNRPGAPPHVGGPAPVSGPRPVHQPHQFHGQQQQQQYQPLPTGPAFHAMVHAQNMQNMHHVRTSSAGSSNDNIDRQRTSSPGPTSPIQPPSRQLPPIPIENIANTMNVIDGAVRYASTASSINSLTSNSSNSNNSNSNNSSSGASSTYQGSATSADGGNEKPSTSRSFRSDFEDIKRNVEALRDRSDGSELAKVVDRGVESVIAAQANIAIGTAGIQAGIAFANKVVSEKGQAIVNHIESNPVLNHLVQLADKLVDIGKTVPFIAPAFVILKVCCGFFLCSCFCIDFILLSMWPKFEPNLLFFMLAYGTSNIP